MLAPAHSPLLTQPLLRKARHMVFLIPSTCDLAFETPAKTYATRLCLAGIVCVVCGRNSPTASNDAMDAASGLRPEGTESMFLVGQKIWHRNGQRSGTVLEIDGDRVYIAQSNGAELDFPVSELTATPPVVGETPGEKLRSRVAAGSSYQAPAPVLTTVDITPEHLRVLAVVPQRTIRSVAALFERRPGAGKFSALGVADKLNVITELTAVSFRTMREYSDRPGELGLLMGKGLADKGS